MHRILLGVVPNGDMKIIGDATIIDDCGCVGAGTMNTV
jgi:hypothetical protein